jgi:RsiW-degrading membrane proteinase PrsW (M82 family)
MSTSPLLFASVYGCRTYSNHAYNSSSPCQDSSTTTNSATNAGPTATGATPQSANTATPDKTPTDQVQLQTQTHEPATSIAQNIADGNWGILLIIIIILAIVFAWLLFVWKRRRHGKQPTSTPPAPRL